MRSGILAAGNFIIDHVKIIEAYPQQDMLASIVSETSSNGGGPYNVLKDLAAMGASFPLEAAGLVGNDSNGEWIIRDCRAAGIDTTQLQHTSEAATSYTDAMTVASTGRRTFFHQRGANALFNETHLNFISTRAKLFHLGYLMLLDSMDSFTSNGRTRASLALEAAKQAGLTTSVDIVSTENPQFREIAESALPFTDHLIINEIEAGKVVGLDLKPSGVVDVEACIHAAELLLQRGVSQQVVIHFVEGAVVADANRTISRQGSLNLPDGFIAGATGAGDAFAAGYLLGLHEGVSTQQCLKLGVCAAAQCLTHPTPSLGLGSAEACLALGERFGFREL
jgi:sugar/nucleoside kinase (ribokinase family)